VHIAALASLVAAAEAHALGALLVALAVATGGSLPQVGAFARARWTALLPDAERLRTALAVESLIDEAVFVVGPVVVTFLATAVAPAAGLLTAIGLAVAGCLLFAAQRRTEPRPQAPPHAEGGGRARSAGAIRHRGLVVIVVTFFAIGAVFGLIEVSVVALARQDGHAGAAGPMLGLWATGSLLAGTAYGAAAWTSSAPRRFVVTVAAFALGTVLIAAAAGSLAAMTVALFVAGLANAPTLITGNTLVPDVVPGHVVTEAYTWVNVIAFAGIAVGSALAGALVDASGPTAGLLAATAAAAGAMLATALGHGALTRPPSRGAA
jgi:predicted MFS family arabinose efflux permease